MFFIVLDLRLTKVGVQRYSFFYARTLHLPGFSGAVCKSGKENGLPHSFYITVSPTRLVIVSVLQLYAQTPVSTVCFIVKQNWFAKKWNAETQRRGEII